MSDCVLNWILFTFCILTGISGLYLAFKREHHNIQNGKPDVQDGGGNFKEGTITFKFAIGLVLLLLGIVGAFLSINNNPDCSQIADKKQKNKEGSTEFSEEAPIEIKAEWQETSVQKLDVVKVKKDTLTGNHHCKSNCRGEPTRTTYSIKIDKQNENGELRNPELKGSRSFFGREKIEVLNSKLIIAYFDVWSRPKRYELVADWIPFSTTTHNRAKSFTIVRDSIVNFEIPRKANNLIFKLTINKDVLSIAGGSIDKLSNSRIKFLKKVPVRDKINYFFQGK